MATYTYVKVKLEETKDLADLNGMMTDLVNTIDFCKELRGSYESGNFGIILVDALSTAILVRYCRCFVTGVRKNIKIDEISSMTTEDKAAHEVYMSMRNKHIAHSVNDLEDNTVVAYYVHERPHEGFSSISMQHGRVVSLSTKDLETIISLSEKFLNYIDEQMELEKQRILALVMKLPMETVLSWGTGEGFRPSLDGVHKRRKK